ncbi:MAG: DNA-binding domain-containing protein [Pseudomonadota bacterium]
MTISQTCFTDAIFDPHAPRPEGLSDGQGRAAGRRFDVYRNNVIVSLIEALEVAFPVILRLVGAENFKILAGDFARAHPPSSPLMMFYGAEMPEFLAGYAPVAGIQYLPDVARLEIAIRESYHAEDAVPVDPSALGALSPEALMQARLTLVPSLRLVLSRWPIHAIWRFNRDPGAPKPQAGAEDVVILRPGFDPAPHLLPAGGGAFIAGLLRGDALGDALAQATAEVPGFDLTQTLTLLIGQAAISDIGDTP